MPPNEDSHNNNHQQGIKNIRNPLMAQQVPITAPTRLHILHQPIHAPDQNEQTREVERAEMTLPGHGTLIRGSRDELGRAQQAKVKDEGDEEEEGEEEDLEDQAEVYDLLAPVEGAGVFGRVGEDCAAWVCRSLACRATATTTTAQRRRESREREGGNTYP